MKIAGFFSKYWFELPNEAETTKSCSLEPEPDFSAVSNKQEIKFKNKSKKNHMRNALKNSFHIRHLEIMHTLTRKRKIKNYKASTPIYFQQTSEIQQIIGQ